MSHLLLRTQRNEVLEEIHDGGLSASDFTWEEIQSDLEVFEHFLVPILRHACAMATILMVPLDLS